MIEGGNQRPIPPLLSTTVSTHLHRYPPQQCCSTTNNRARSCLGTRRPTSSPLSTMAPPRIHRHPPPMQQLLEELRESSSPVCGSDPSCPPHYHRADHHQIDDLFLAVITLLHHLPSRPRSDLKEATTRVTTTRGVAALGFELPLVSLVNK
jgi:hypothetical protein